MKFYSRFFVIQTNPLCMQKNGNLEKDSVLLDQKTANVLVIIFRKQLFIQMRTKQSTIMTPQLRNYPSDDFTKGERLSRESGAENCLWSSSGPLLSLRRCCHFPRQWSPGGFRDWPFHGQAGRLRFRALLPESARHRAHHYWLQELSFHS